MKVEKNEILLIYNSGSVQDREALAYAKTLKNYTVKEFDLKYDQLTESQLIQISDQLELDPKELIDTKSPKYLRYYRNTELTPKSTVKMLKQNPEVIRTPIAIYNDRTEFIKTPKEFIKKDMTI